MIADGRRLQWIPVIRRNHAAYLRAQHDQRAAAIAAIGWAPEGRASQGEDYCAGTHELLELVPPLERGRIIATFEAARQAAGFGPNNF